MHVLQMYALNYRCMHVFYVCMQKEYRLFNIYTNVQYCIYPFETFSNSKLCFQDF